MVWIINAAHRVLGLPGPGMIAVWAYLTLVWVLEGQSLYILVSLIIFGLRYKGWAPNTYTVWNTGIALLQLLPMGMIQSIIHKLRWIDHRVLWSEQTQQHLETAKHRVTIGA